jgi:integrase/recombinase XerD
MENLLELAESWQIHLASRNLSGQTRSSYRAAVTKYLNWCGENDISEPMSRRAIEKFAADSLSGGDEPTTVRLRHYALKGFAKWLTDEEEIPANPFIGLSPPKQHVKLVPALTDEQVTKILASCKGTDFSDRRDDAIFRFMVETGVRASELVAMDISDIDLRALTAVVRKGKGAKARLVPFSPTAAASLDRYIRVRKRRNPMSTRMWLNNKNSNPMSYDTLIYSLKKRAEKAGIKNFYPHKTRHTAATRWLRAGGSESGLMAITGWETRQMIDRYTRASASERATEESRRLNLGF